VTALRFMSRMLLVAVAMLATGGVGAQAKSAQAAVSDRDILVMLRLTPDHFRPNANYGGSYGDRLTNRQRRELALRIAHRYHLDLVGEGWPMPLLGIDCYAMRVPVGTAMQTAIDQVSRDPLVAWSQPVNRFQTLAQKPGGTPRGTDPLLAAQPAATAWRLADLHRVATGRGVTVAIVDSGIEANHPDLVGRVAISENFVDMRANVVERHGTGVAGIIAAQADNGIGIAGVAPDARLLALRACWQSGTTLAAPTYCDSLSLAKAIQFSIQHSAQIINLSLSGPPDRLLDRLLDVAAERKIAVVAAYDLALADGGFPASRTDVIAVGNEDLASYPKRVYIAPGHDVPTTQPGGKWGLVDGSSYATAHISGLIALVRESRTHPGRTELALHGGGHVVDACATLRLVGKECGCTCSVTKR
jgi:hypothetical protein